MSPSSKGAAAIFAAAMRVRTRVAASLARLGDCKLLKMLFMFVVLYSVLLQVCVVSRTFRSLASQYGSAAQIFQRAERIFRRLLVNPDRDSFWLWQKSSVRLKEMAGQVRISNDE